MSEIAAYVIVNGSYSHDAPAAAHLLTLLPSLSHALPQPQMLIVCKLIAHHLVKHVGDFWRHGKVTVLLLLLVLKCNVYWPKRESRLLLMFLLFAFQIWLFFSISISFSLFLFSSCEQHAILIVIVVSVLTVNYVVIFPDKLPSIISNGSTQSR